MELRMNQDNSKEVLLSLKDLKRKALEEIGLQAEGYVQLITPVDTGRLRASISHRVIDENSVAIGTNVEYAAYVERGTSKTRAQPYLKPGVMNHLDEYKRIAESVLKGRI